MLFVLQLLALSLLQIREASLENQVKQLLEELREAKKHQTPVRRSID